jgi:hypothetical protein
MPSPAFPAERLESTRPLLAAGRARVMPAVSGGSFDSSDAPLPMVPPLAPVQVTVVTPAVPVPVAPVAPADDQPALVVNPLSVILLTPPAGANTETAGNPAATSATPAPATAATPAPSAHNGDHHPPRRDPPQNEPPGKRFRAGESEIYREVQKSFEANDFHRALTGLDAWSEHFPRTDFESDREFQYVQAYDATGQPAKAVEIAGKMLTQGLSAQLPDPRQALTLLYLASLDVQKIPRPSHDQFATGQQAAHELLQRLPDFFVSRPANTSDAQWRKLRQDLESVATSTLAMGERRRGAR